MKQKEYILFMGGAEFYEYQAGTLYPIIVLKSFTYTDMIWVGK